MSVLIRRDPFAREELHREELAREYCHLGCDWCGGTNARGRLYRYSVQRDGGGHGQDAKSFCSLDCREIYYDA